jgi:uridine kinase
VTTLADVVRELCASSATTVLIDGRSGSGKSTLAKQLCRNWTDTALVRMDDVYPGWDGLQWATDHVQTSLLQPRADGAAGHWRSWSWVRNRPGVWHAIEPGTRLVVEGVGVLTSSSRALADLAIWVEADDADRKRRALSRQAGDDYASHWDDWAAQEDAFLRTHHPRDHADLIARAEFDGFHLTRCATLRQLERGSSEPPG